jgi:hypothetical protein
MSSDVAKHIGIKYFVVKIESRIKQLRLGI